MKKLFGVLIASVVIIPVSSFAMLTTNEQTTIDSYIQRRSTQYTAQQVDMRATRIIDRIQRTLEVSRLNQFTYDVLVYIADVLQDYQVEDTSSVSDSSTPATTDGDTVDQDQNEDTSDETQTSSSSTPTINTIIANRIATFDEDREVVLLAGTQGQVVASFEFNARLEPFVLENLELVSTTSDIQQSIAQLHLYTQDGIKLGSDRANSMGNFEFRNIEYTLPQGTTTLYAVVDTMIVGFNSNGGDDLVSFSLRVNTGEATGEFSSSDYSVGQGATSELITLQSVLITEVDILESAEGVTSSSRLTNGSNVLSVLKLQTAESNNNEISSPRDLDTRLQTVRLTVNDNTTGESVKNSLVLRRIDRNGEAIQGVVQGDEVVFTFSDDTGGLINNGSDAYYRIEATDVRLDPNRGESARIEINDLRTAITYTSSDPSSSTFNKNTDEKFVISLQSISD